MQRGTTLGPYRLVEPLGAGGMGEVWLAVDSRLDREVAIKVLPEKLAADEERLARFRQEARLLAAVNHPNIATIYGLETAYDAPFLVLEVVKGRSLSDRLEEGRLPAFQALEVALQVAAALEAAHERGIVHRDLKPGNVMLAANGLTKVLDFGLAKSVVLPPDGGQRRTDVRTREHLTAEGAVVGTTAYMSPEQTRAQDVDARTDLWSFGCVLYEMLTGSEAFGRDTTADTLAAILTVDPDWSALPRSTPSGVRRLLSRCLEKDAASRLADAGLVRLAVERALQALSGGRGGPAEADEEGEEEGRTVRDAGRSRSGPYSRVSTGIPHGIRPAPATGYGEGAASIAVLPFTSVGGGPEDEYFGDGLAEDLINALSRIPDLRVASRTSSFQFRARGLTADVREIGRTLGIDKALEGSIRHAEDRLRVTARLVDTRSGMQVWSERFDREMTDVFAIQDEIARAIADRLEVTLGDSSASGLVKRYTEDVSAYHLYMQGRYFWNKRFAVGLEKSMDYFRQAIEADPDLALAHSGLADAYWSLGTNMFLPPDQAFPAAMASATRALEIDPDLAEAHVAVAIATAWYEWDWERSVEFFQRALELNPDYPVAHGYYGLVLAFLGRMEEALEEATRAQLLDPFASWVLSAKAALVSMAGRHEEAIELCRQAFHLDPAVFTSQWVLGWAQQRAGRVEEAIETFRSACDAFGRLPAFLGFLGHALARSGREDEARQTIAELDRQRAERYVSPSFFAWVHHGLGEKDAAREWLEEAFAERGGPPAFLWYGPFDEFLERMGLPTAKERQEAGH